MRCSRYGERWDVDEPGLMAEAFEECLADAGIEKKDIQAAWFCSAMDPQSGRDALNERGGGLHRW